MSKTMQNLFQKEEIIKLNLTNISYQLSNYIRDLEKLKLENNLGDLQAKADWFTKIYEYYQNDLMPALKESIEMEERHLKIMENNPDASFRPIKNEIIFHQKLTNKFIERFMKLHIEFHAFTVNVKGLNN